jgi:predicted nucleic acid-binding protein
MTTLPRHHPNWVFSDTSGYYAAAVEDDQRTPQAVATLSRLERERVRFFTTPFVLAELHALVITRRRNPQLALALLTRIESGATTVAPVTSHDHAQARAILGQRQDKLYSLTDALSFAVMERLGIFRVFTFDHNFKQHGFQGNVDVGVLQRPDAQRHAGSGGEAIGPAPISGR